MSDHCCGRYGHENSEFAQKKLNCGLKQVIEAIEMQTIALYAQAVCFWACFLQLGRIDFPHQRGKRTKQDRYEYNLKKHRNIIQCILAHTFLRCCVSEDCGFVNPLRLCGHSIITIEVCRLTDVLTKVCVTQTDGCCGECLCRPRPRLLEALLLVCGGSRTLSLCGMCLGFEWVSKMLGLDELSARLMWGLAHFTWRFAGPNNFNY